MFIGPLSSKGRNYKAKQYVEYSVFLNNKQHDATSNGVSNRRSNICQSLALSFFAGDPEEQAGAGIMDQPLRIQKLGNLGQR